MAHPKRASTPKPVPAKGPLRVPTHWVATDDQDMVSFVRLVINGPVLAGPWSRLVPDWCAEWYALSENAPELRCGYAISAIAMVVERAEDRTAAVRAAVAAWRLGGDTALHAFVQGEL